MSSNTNSPGGRSQRRLRNYLLDPGFQLKYTGYLVAIALLLSVSLGVALWWTSSAVLAQSNMAVSQGEHAVQQGQHLVKLGQQVVSESKKVSEVVKMNIVKDPVYSEDPELAKAFKADASKRDAMLEKQQQELEQQAKELSKRAADLKQQSANIAREQTTMFAVLVSVLTALVLGIGIAGVLVTHRIAGPIYKMKRQLAEVGDGKLKVPAPLRKGDELVDFFEAFSAMVKSLRSRQQQEIGELEAAIERLEATPEGKVTAEPFRLLLGRMRDSLEF